ncbi:MAG: DNA-processing protein DprA [Oscillospiraceae bacterium]|nr:DNA-processing protein DprA [Oscillospiraceae bacterium]
MLLHWLWLTELPDISLREKHKLLTYFSEPEDLFSASAETLAQVQWLKPEQIRVLLDKSLDRVEKLLETCVKKSIHILTFHDRGYPPLLREIEDPPLLLYYKGDLPVFSENLMLGVVGTRHASAYGLSSAKQMAHGIARCGGIVVTGLAVGIDSKAAEGALAAQGCVVGVLGCAIDNIYPARNRALYERVQRQGCLLSEYPPGARTLPWNFLRRNRIISGMSRGVLIVEAPEKSGALNTAAHCLEQGRDVYVVPGNIGVASCAGSNALLRQGAMAAFTGWDAVQDYAEEFPDKLKRDDTPLTEESVSYLYVAQEVTIPGGNSTPKEEIDKKSVDNLSAGAYSGEETGLPEAERTVLELLTPGEHFTDDIIAQAPMEPGVALAALTTLTVMGYARSLPGRRVTRIK